MSRLAVADHLDAALVVAIHAHQVGAPVGLHDPRIAELGQIARLVRHVEDPLLDPGLRRPGLAEGAPALGASQSLRRRLPNLHRIRAPSSVQPKVEPVSLELNAKVAVSEVAVPDGPASIVVSGGVLSTVTVRLAEVVRLVEVSTATAVIVAGPSAWVAESQLVEYGSVVSLPTTTSSSRSTHSS